MRATQWISRGRSIDVGHQVAVVEVEPARARRLVAFRIDRDDLEVQALAELHERVVRAHRDVLAAGPRRAPVSSAMCSMPCARVGAAKTRWSISASGATVMKATRCDPCRPGLRRLRLARVEIELDARAVRIEEEHLPRAGAGLAAMRVVDAEPVEPRKRLGETLRGERHVIDDAGPELLLRHVRRTRAGSDARPRRATRPESPGRAAGRARRPTTSR